MTKETWNNLNNISLNSVYICTCTRMPDGKLLPDPLCLCNPRNKLPTQPPTVTSNNTCDMFGNYQFKDLIQPQVAPTHFHLDKDATNWQESEDRVSGILQRLSDGERHLLYRMLYGAPYNIRIDYCKDAENKAKKAFPKV